MKEGRYFTRNTFPYILPRTAAMAELVDALDSGSSRGNSVDVRVILAAKHFI
jgi:hypothetical protein